MTEANSTRKPRRRKPKKPSKPYPEFPLYAHASKRWAKKVRGKTLFFGPWSDPEGALAKWLAQKDALVAGKTPRIEPQGLTVRALVNRFLTSKRRLLDARELAPQTWRDFYLACQCIIDQFGDRLVEDLAADDFERLRAALAKKWGAHRLGSTIQRIRGVFKFGYDSGLIDRPVRYGPSFKKPAKRTMRLEKAKGGIRMFEREEILLMLLKASPALEAMILLGVNAGLGNTDCGTLEFRHLDLQGGWLDFPRPKTGVARKAKLWPETVAALRAVIANRSQPKDPADAEKVFITSFGLPWTKASAEIKEDGTVKVRTDDAISKEIKKVLTVLDLNGKRRFYALRHSFRTIADDAKDTAAVDLAMGHESEGMAVHYRERISNDRLVSVSEHVRRWLFGKSTSS
jgi:integrase